MQEYGLKIFNIDKGLFVLTMLMSIRSLQACSEKHLERIFLFGAFKEMLADKPNIKRPYEEYKISNRAKNNISLCRMHTLLYSKCFYLGECHNYDYRLSNVEILD